MAEQPAPQFIAEVPPDLRAQAEGLKVPKLTEPQPMPFTVKEVDSMLVEINGTVNNQDRSRWRIDSEGNLPRELRLYDEALVIRSDGTVEAGWQIVNTVRGTDGLSDTVTVQALNPGEEGGTLTKVYSLGFFMEMQLEIAERIEAKQDRAAAEEAEEAEEAGDRGLSPEQGHCKSIAEIRAAVAAVAIEGGVSVTSGVERMREEAEALEAKFASDSAYQVIADLEKQCANLKRQMEYNWGATYQDDPKNEHKARISNKLQRERGPIYQRMTKHPDYESYQDDKRKLAQLQAAIEEASR